MPDGAHNHRASPLRLAAACLFALMVPAAGGEPEDPIAGYNIVWTTPSKDSSESMPCGGGDIGLNVWVEDGAVLFYMQRSGSLAEQNEYLKLGRVRLQLDPNPFGKAISYHWESQLEHAYMIFEYRRFFGADISKYIPFIENAVVFFDKHYRKREEMRSGRELDGSGHLILFPSKACETFRGATNPADLIAGLHACVDQILTLDDGALKLRDKAWCRAFKQTIPPYTYTDNNAGYAKPGTRVILPAKSWKTSGNGELPMLYPLFPFNRFALGTDDMQVFRDTYELGKFRKGNVISWHQDGIFFARMGQTDQAVDFNSRKLDDSPRRFPTFWGPGHDWMPDHNWGGSGMIGLQEMLMQTIGDEIRLLPAWPEDWDVDFKLHAPRQTTVKGKVRGGKVVELEVSPDSRNADVVIGLD